MANSKPTVDPEMGTTGTEALAGELAKVNEQLSKMNADTPEKAAQAIEKLKSAIEQSTPALLEMKRAELSDIASKVDHIKKVETLRDRYTELSKQENLNAEQKGELASVVNQLKQEYPSLFAMMDEEGRLHIQNLDVVNERIAAEHSFVDTSANGMKAYLENLRQTTQAQANEVKTQIENIMKLASAYNAANQMYGTNVSMDNWAIGAEASLPRLTNDYNKQIVNLNEIDKALNSISSGNWSDFKPRSPFSNSSGGDSGSKKGGGGRGDSGKTPDEIAQDLYQQEMKVLQFKRDMNQISDQEEADALKDMLARYQNYADIRMEIELKIHQLEDQMSQDSFNFSRQWIEDEELRMKASGKSEDEIAQMKTDAWTRVRNRYADDTEYYKQAERSLLELKIDAMQKAAKAQEDALKKVKETASKNIEETEKEELKSIDKRKQAIEDLYKEKQRQLEADEKRELASIDQRKQAIQDYYDAQVGAIDDQNQADQRKELADEVEKYRYSASKEGQDRYKELVKQLQKFDDDARKKALQKERDDKLDELDKEKKDVEDHYDSVKQAQEDAKESELRRLDDQREAVQSYYDDVKNAFDNYAGNVAQIEQLLQDQRLQSFLSTNDRMKSELQSLAAEYAQVQFGYSSDGSSYSDSSSSSGGWSAQDLEVINAMRQNSLAWGQTDDEETRTMLHNSNRSLATIIGATYDDQLGWVKNGRPLYHSGGVISGLGEVGITALAGEMVLTKGQQRWLFDTISKGSASNNSSTTYNSPLVYVGELHVRDDNDVQQISRELYNLQQSALRSRGGR
jgi:hypothetical protein